MTEDEKNSDRARRYWGYYDKAIKDKLFHSEQEKRITVNMVFKLTCVPIIQHDEICSAEELEEHINNFIDTLPDDTYSLAEFGKTLWAKFKQWEPLNALNFACYRGMMFDDATLKRRRIPDNSVSFLVQPDIKETIEIKEIKP